jgi:LexA-binding, inner membrane-associated putative hydrolase
LSHLRVYTDPLQHALIAALVVAPLVPRAGPGVVATAVGSGLVIDVDHAVAARSVRVQAMTTLGMRPRSHSVLTALGAGAVVTAAAGPLHGWAAFGGLASHLLHDAGGPGAPTPLLWPFAPPPRVGRRRQLVGTTLLVLGSAVLSWATAAASPSSTAAAAGGDA